MRPTGTDRGRRRFLGGAALATVWAAGGWVLPRSARAFANLTPPPRSASARFTFSQLAFAGAWDPEPTAAALLIEALERNTSVEAHPARRILAIGDEALFGEPFLWLAGREEFPRLAAPEISRLRSWLDAGGTLVVDDGTGVPGSAFDAGIRRELARIYPEVGLARLPADHTVFKSFFLVRSAAGRVAASPFLEGITVRGRTSVILSPNDLFGAWARDPLGRWAHECRPGGERQRRTSLHLGVNLLLYALCGDYKQDLIHEPFLRQRS